MIQILANHHRRDVAERWVGEIFQTLAGEQYTRDDIRVDAVVCTPVVVIFINGSLFPFAKSSFRRGPVSGGAAQVQVRAEAQ